MIDASDTLEHQVQAIDLSSVATEKKFDELQAKSGTDLANIQGLVMASTPPEE